MQPIKLGKLFILVLAAAVLFAACAKEEPSPETTVTAPPATTATTTAPTEAPSTTEETTVPPETEPTEDVPDPDDVMRTISWNSSWQYADYSKIHSDSVTLYRSIAPERKEKVVCINAGHGTKGGSSVKTQCHPDGSPKVTGGSTAKGAVTATAINEGTSLFNGTSEAAANLSLALIVKDKLLESGYDVLMIRESSDVQLDNIARTVIANNNADCHIALHYDSTESDKGLFYLSVPDVSSYRAMEPVKSHWQQHEALGQALLDGERAAGVKIFSNGKMAIDLTQTSYSTIPSVDLEVGDRASDSSEATQNKIANGIVEGLNIYFS